MSSIERSVVRSILLDAAAAAARLLPQPIKKAIYHSGPLARLVRASLNKAAPAGESPTKIAGGDLAGITMMLDLQQEKDYWLGNYEPDLQAAVRRFTRTGMVVYDIGANIGYISLLFAKVVGKTGRVYAFEALPANLERLRRNIELNPGMAPIEPVSGAVTDKAQAVRFLVHSSTSMGKAAGSGGRVEESYAGEIEVAGIVVDEFIFEQGNRAPQVVKMDIEGGEVMAIGGMRRMLTEIHPLMLVELHGPEAARAVCEALWVHGYRILHLSHGYPAVTSLEELDWKSYIVAEKPEA